MGNAHDTQLFRCASELVRLPTGIAATKELHSHLRASPELSGAASAISLTCEIYKFVAQAGACIVLRSTAPYKESFPPEGWNRNGPRVPIDLADVYPLTGTGEKAHRDSRNLHGLRRNQDALHMGRHLAALGAQAPLS